MKSSVSVLIWISGLMFISAVSNLNAQSLRVLVESDSPSSSLTFQSLSDETIILIGDSFPEKIGSLSPFEKVRIRGQAGQVYLLLDSSDLGPYESVFFLSQDSVPKFNLLYDRKTDPIIRFPDHLLVTAVRNHLQLVNEVFLENYLPQVIRSEAGGHRSLEFFKVQALSARTYALAQIGRHSGDGFDLCDRTHCQVYEGNYTSVPLIDEAVAATQGEVIVSEDGQLIEAVFSANCGGFTANSEDVWVSKVDYLRAVSDKNYCKGFDNHAWHLSLGKPEFLKKLGDFHQTVVDSFRIKADANGRVKKLVLNGDHRLTITGEECRRIFRLKSSKFHVKESGDQLMIEGSGYGHGVGLCQDGAFFLSELGMDYEKIIQHYYQGVQVKKVEEVRKKLEKPEPEN